MIIAILFGALVLLLVGYGVGYDDGRKAERAADAAEAFDRVLLSRGRHTPRSNEHAMN
jgi:hypothetical protein